MKLPLITDNNIFYTFAPLFLLEHQLFTNDFVFSGAAKY